MELLSAFDSFLILYNEFQVLGTDLEGQLKTSPGLNVKDGFLVLNASQLPPSVRVVSAARLKEGHLGESFGGELQDSVRSVQLKIVYLLCRPDFLVVVPDTNSDVVVLTVNKDIFGHCYLNADRVRLDLACGVGVWNVS
jgi:hypothetical protein